MRPDLNQPASTKAGAIHFTLSPGAERERERDTIKMVFDDNASRLVTLPGGDLVHLDTEKSVTHYELEFSIDHAARDVRVHSVKAQLQVHPYPLTADGATRMLVDRVSRMSTNQRAEALLDDVEEASKRLREAFEPKTRSRLEKMSYFVQNTNSRVKAALAAEVNKLEPARRLQFLENTQAMLWRSDKNRLPAETVMQDLVNELLTPALIYEAELQRLSADRPTKKATVDGAEWDSGVSEVFYKDFNENVYSIGGTLANGSALGQRDDKAMQVGMGAFAGQLGNRADLVRVSQYAVKDIWNGLINKVALTPASPFTLGKHRGMLYGDRKTTFDIRSDGHGGHYVKSRTEWASPLRFLDPQTKKMTQLSEDSTATGELEIHLASDGAVTCTQLPVVKCKLKAASNAAT